MGRPHPYLPWPQLSISQHALQRPKGWDYRWPPHPLQTGAACAARPHPLPLPTLLTLMGSHGGQGLGLTPGNPFTSSPPSSQGPHVIWAARSMDSDSDNKMFASPD